MVVDNLDFKRMSIAPFETYSPLIVDANTILSSPISLQSFQSIPWRGGQILKRDGRIQSPQSRSRRILEGLEPQNAVSCVERFRVRTAERLNHTDFILRYP